jgi:neurofibromin 1
LERATNRLFEVLIDLTQFGRSNEVPVQWINQLMQLISDDRADSISAIYIYNPNSYLRTFIKKLTRPITHKFSKRIFFAVTLAEIQEYIQPSEIRLPKATTGLETEPSAVFFPVNKIIQFRTQIPVTVKIGAEYIQIMTVRKQEILYSLSAVTNDVYHIAEIEDIVYTQYERNTEQTTEFSFESTRDNLQINFSSPKRDVIVNVSHLFAKIIKYCI